MSNNVIVNGSFTLGNTGWSGTDLETNYAEKAYLGNGSTNAVAELDGHTGQTTVMSQTFSIKAALTTDLTFRTALRTASLSQAGTEGFRVDVLDALGQIVTTRTFLPGTTAWTDHVMSVSFPAGGSYTIRMTELGKDDSLGAIIDDVAMLVCFTADTMIETATGERAAASLKVGDLVWTLDAGLQALRWIGTRHVTVAEQKADPSLRPIRFAPGSLGDGAPLRTMTLSPQHRLWRRGWKAELLFGHAEVLVPAKAFVNGRTVTRAEPEEPVTYLHFLLDGHQIVRSDGALTESFFPSALSLTGLGGDTLAELMHLFPDSASLALAYPRTARPVLRGAEARLVA